MKINEVTTSRLTKGDILSIVRENQKRIRSFGATKIGLFGSFARGDQKSDSDIDLVVEFASGQKTFDNFMHLTFMLEDLFGSKVDLLTLESISPYIRPHISREVDYVQISP